MTRRNMILVLNEEFAVDLGICFTSRKAVSLLFVTTSACIALENTVGLNAVVFCACEVIQLFSVVFCVLRGVHKFDLRLATH